MKDPDKMSYDEKVNEVIAMIAVSPGRNRERTQVLLDALVDVAVDVHGLTRAVATERVGAIVGYLAHREVLRQYGVQPSEPA